MILLAFLACAGLGVAIMAIAQIGTLRARIESLEAALRRSGSGDAQPVVAKPSPSVPPPLPQFVNQPSPRSIASTPLPVIETAHQHPAVNWESFVGVRMFAWIGGLAFFLGVVFFVKYAFENNLISPRIRIAVSALVGLTLIGIGLLPVLRKYRIPSQSLIATGLLILYADIYAAHSFYGLVSLTFASVLMWGITALALGLGARTDAPGILWLAVIGGFLTPLLFRNRYQSTAGLFGYLGVVNCAVAAVSVVKRWHYFIAAAAACTVAIEFAWAADCFGTTDAEVARVVFFVFQFLFLLIAVALVQTGRSHNWSLLAGAIAGSAPLIGAIVDPLSSLTAWDFGLFTLLLGSAGLVALAAFHSRGKVQSKAALIVALSALVLGVLAEWRWFCAFGNNGGLNDASLVITSHMAAVATWHAVIFLVFVATPYLSGPHQKWPWLISAVAGLPQFGFVYYYLTVPAGLSPGNPVIPHRWWWVIPLTFALPAAAGIRYLISKERLKLTSGDSRLASQGAALIAFVSLMFPVQLDREWITIGWALEGVGLILLYQALPNRRLRAIALIVFSAAFVRLALNPAVLHYHPRTPTPILNWYLYVYGAVALCLFAGGYWFGSPKERLYEKHGPALLYGLSGLVLFLLLNIEIADYFSIGPTLTFSFAGNFARDMTYTISWSLFAFGMLLIGMIKQIRPLRFGAVALLCLALVKLFFHDLDNLSQLYRIAAFISVAIIAIVASFTYQQFLSAPAKQ
ncbi:MAG: DUF2339 domain-containing protein [Chthoniobacterales bacterium]